jgi:D-alanyl-lipoteichoic acid acyltransferase DltB (MBOAT superfamily)
MMDYIFTPLQMRFRYWGLAGTGIAILGTFLFSGLWHGAAWHFVFWGCFHGVLFFGYHLLGLTGKWKPQGTVRIAAAWAVMFAFTVFGWMLFRTPSLGWLWENLTAGHWGLSGDSLLAGLSILALVAFYALPMVALLILNQRFPHARRAHAVFYGLAILAIVMLARDKVQDFIYFQF